MINPKTPKLKKIRDAVLNLKESPLYEYRKQNHYFPVLGEGNHDANIVFVGEAPGKTEAETGRPFCGAAGRILEELLTNIGLKRENVYITNIVKDRPPNNRDPLPLEIEIYSPFLISQLQIIKPKVIVTLGRFSTKFILEKLDLPEKDLSISVIRGKILETNGLLGKVSVIPLFHPAVALYSTQSKETLKSDFLILKQFI